MSVRCSHSALARTFPASLTLAVALAGSIPTPLDAADNRTTLKLTLRSRKSVKQEGKPDADTLVREQVVWEAKQTALIICDMWDGHWCKGAARRVGEMAGPMNKVMHTARDKGMLIIHAPSSVVDYYAGTPQRRMALQAPLVKTPIPLSKKQRWGTGWCWPDPKREPGMPIDDSDMGCDCDVLCKLPAPGVSPWTRQIKTIDMKQGDAISHDGQEVYNLLARRKIDNVLIMGVHLNMCVLGRPFGIRQLVHVGKNVVLVRDMTDTMYNHRMKPFVNHFRGTDLVVEHVEKYWCPTVTSDQFAGGKPFRFAESSNNENDDRSVPDK